jgi:hypothetical protein
MFEISGCSDLDLNLQSWVLRLALIERSVLRSITQH